MSRHISRHILKIKNMRKIGQQNIRKVQKSHGVYYVSIPIKIVRSMKLQEKQKVVFDYDDKKQKIIIKDWKK